MIKNIIVILRHLKKSKKYWISTQLVSVFLQFIITFVLAYCLERFYENITKKDSVLIALLVYLMFSYFFKVTMNYIEQYFMVNSQTMIKNDLYTEKLKGIDKTDKYVWDSSKTFSEIAQNVEVVAELIGNSITYFVSSIVLLCIYMFTIFKVDVIFGITYFLIFLCSTVIHIMYYSKMDKYKVEQQKYIGLSNSLCSQFITGSAEVKAYGIKNRVLFQHSTIVQGIKESQMKYESLYMKHELWSNLLYYVSEILPIVLGVFMLLISPIGIGKIMFLTQFTQYLSIYMMDFSDSFCQIKVSKGIISNFCRQLDICEKKVNHIELSSEGRKFIIEINNMMVSYGRHTVVKNFNLKCTAGQSIAILGESGSGKTSILDAIMQFVEYEGECYFLGENMKNLSDKFVRKNISYQDQDNILMDVSIYENICMGDFSIPKVEVEKVCKLVDAYDFICDLPEGFDTNIRKAGVNFSAGQIQRICLARAMLRKVPLLLLDEPTASLDIVTENKILKELFNKEQALIVTTHRLAILQKVDWIIVLNEGSIVAEGSYGQLLSQIENFIKLYEIQ